MAEFLNSNVKHLRTVKKLSQQQLADKIGIDRSTVSRIENNEVETTVENAIKIADVLGVSMNDLLNKDLTNENYLISNQLDILYNKTKDILSDDDIETMKFLMEKTIRNYEESKKNQ